MATDPPELRSRHERLLAYLRFNGARMAVDLFVIAAWILVNVSVFAWFSLPTWSLYVWLFAGIFVYSRITRTWERPYRSPDLPEESNSEEL